MEDPVAAWACSGVVADRAARRPAAGPAGPRRHRRGEAGGPVRRRHRRAGRWRADFGRTSCVHRSPPARRGISGAVAPGTVMQDQTIPGPGGDQTVRVYQPVRPNSGARPLIVYFHGGGFVFGDLRLGDWLCSSVAVTVGAVVVSVEYRLAPRHRFPAAGGERQRAVHPPAGDACLPQALPGRRGSPRPAGLASARRPRPALDGQGAQRV